MSASLVTALLLVVGCMLIPGSALAQGNFAPMCGFPPYQPIPATLNHPVHVGDCSANGNVHVKIVAQGTKGVLSVTNNDTPEAGLEYAARVAGVDSFKVTASDDLGVESQIYSEETYAATPSQFGGGDTDGPSFPKAFEGISNAGTMQVSQQGSFALKAQVNCTGTGPNCKVTDALSADLASTSAKKKKKKKKAVKLGGSTYTVKAGKKGAVHVKLTKKGLKLLKRKHKIKGRVKTTVKRGSTTTTKTFSVTLKAPKK